MLLYTCFITAGDFKKRKNSADSKIHIIFFFFLLLMSILSAWALNFKQYGACVISCWFYMKKILQFSDHIIIFYKIGGDYSGVFVTYNDRFMFIFFFWSLVFLCFLFIFLFFFETKHFSFNLRGLFIYNFIPCGFICTIL